MKKPVSREGISPDKNAEQSGYQPDYNAMHYDVPRPSSKKDWGKKAEPLKPRPAPKPSKDRGRSR